jgi:hypothetical protein
MTAASGAAHHSRNVALDGIIQFGRTVIRVEDAICKTGERKE